MAVIGAISLSDGTLQPTASEISRDTNYVAAKSYISIRVSCLAIWLTLRSDQ